MRIHTIQSVEVGIAPDSFGCQARQFLHLLLQVRNALAEHLHTRRRGMVHDALQVQGACTDQLDDLCNGPQLRGEDEDGEVEVRDKAFTGPREL